MLKKYILIYLFTAALFSSCSAPMRYQNNLFDKRFFESKTIYFSLSDKSDDVRIVKEGPNTGETKIPDNRAVFKKSIEDLALETKLNLVYAESGIITKNDAIAINVTITRLNWLFSFSSATLKSDVHYEIGSDNTSYDIVGIHKNYSGGSKEWNLYNSLKNANYLFLKELEKK